MKKDYYISGWDSSINTIIYGLIYLILFIPGIIFAQGSDKTLTFNGTDNAIDLGDFIANNCRTIEMWFKPYNDINSSTEPVSLIVRDFNNGDGLSTNEFQICFIPDSWSGGNLGGKIAFYRRIGSTRYEIFSDKNEWSANHWYHVAVTIETVDGMKMYINGVLQKSTDPSTDPIRTQSGNVTDKVSIGKWGNVNIRYFSGEIDEVRIWEIEKTQAEIREKMCSKLTGNEPGLRAYYRFDGESENILIDDSPNSYDGILLNMDQSNRTYSGAPIGDISTYLYDNKDLANKSLLLDSGPGDKFLVKEIISPAKGVHIYKVNALPNSLQNLDNPSTGNYYGVFLCDISGTFSIQYDYADYVCSSCDKIFGRNDNSILSWTDLNGIIGDCSYKLSGHSPAGYDYRSEFIVDKNGNDIDLDLGNDTTLCAGTTLILDASIPNALGYIWQDGLTGPVYHASAPGSYKVIVDTDCGLFSDSIEIFFHDDIILNLGNDTTICDETTIILDATIPNALGYRWQDGSTEPVYFATGPGSYRVTVGTECGFISDSIQLITPEVEDIYIPNVITPNNDGYNDYFKISGTDSEISLVIFNRMGREVYRSYNYGDDWSGQNLSPGVYYYLINTGCRKQEYKGWIKVLY